VEMMKENYDRAARELSSLREKLSPEQKEKYLKLDAENKLDTLEDFKKAHDKEMSKTQQFSTIKEKGKMMTDAEKRTAEDEKKKESADLETQPDRDFIPPEPQPDRDFIPPETQEDRDFWTEEEEK